MTGPPETIPDTGRYHNSLSTWQAICRQAVQKREKESDSLALPDLPLVKLLAKEVELL